MTLREKLVSAEKAYESARNEPYKHARQWAQKKQSEMYWFNEISRLKAILARYKIP